MHLLYIWISEYGKVKEQGVKLSSKYKISVKRTQKTKNGLPVYEINIQTNTTFIENFFGTGIFDIAVAVGQNGSGKTTLAHMIMECASEALQIENNLGKYIGHNKKSCILIYEKTEGENKNPHIYINANNFEYEIAKSNNQLTISKLDSGNSFVQPLSYFSNVFNSSELRDSFVTGYINISSIVQQQIYTPSVIMKRNQEERRKAYHHYVDNSYNAALYTLADIQMQNVIQSYEDYQAVSFLNCFFQSPDSIKTELPIFDKLTIHFRPFAEELVFDQEEKQDVQKWLDSFTKPNSGVNEKSNSNLPKSYYLSRYILEFCKLFGYQYIVYQRKPDWKLHVMACLFSEVIALLFGALLDYICDLLSPDFDIMNIKFWDDLKEWLEAAKQNNDCCKDDNHMKYIITMFNKYYNEAKEILAGDTYEEIAQGSYRLEDIKKFLRFYRNSYTRYRIWTKYISIEFHPSSSGELSMVNLVSYMYQAFAKPNTNNEDILIIIDELDAYLHPRWQQGILSWLLKWWQDDNLFKKYNIQIFFTTHSPILLSDIPGDKVIYLHKESQHIYLEESNHKTFGADIYMLFYDSFFMDKGSIGEFAKNKVDELINWLKKDDSEMGEKEVLYLLESIGDHNAFIQLKRMYEEKKYKASIPDGFRYKLEHLSQEEKKILEEYIRKSEEKND